MKDGEKFVAVLYSGGRVAMLLRVANFDDGFMAELANAERAWESSQDDFDSFVLAYLRNRGYELEPVEDYEQYASDL